MCRLPLGTASGGYSLLQYTGSQPRGIRVDSCETWAQWLWGVGSVAVVHGLSGCGARAQWLWGAGSVVVVHGLSCSVACELFPNPGNPYPLHWQAASQALDHQGSLDSLDSCEDRLFWLSSLLIRGDTQVNIEVILVAEGFLGSCPQNPPYLVPPHPDVKQSFCSSREELISEILDRIISSPSHTFLSGKITQPTQQPLWVPTHSRSHCSPHLPAKNLPISAKQGEAWEKEGEAEERKGG